MYHQLLQHTGPPTRRLCEAPHSRWGYALEDLYKAPRAARIAVVEIAGETRRYERTVSNGWKRTV